jgi:hypothetical protein
MPALPIQLQPFRQQPCRSRRLLVPGRGIPRTRAAGSLVLKQHHSRLQRRANLPPTEARSRRACPRRRRRSPLRRLLRRPECRQRRGCCSHRPNRSVVPIRATALAERQATGPAGRSSPTTPHRHRETCGRPPTRSRLRARSGSDLMHVVQVQSWTATAAHLRRDASLP